MTTVDDTIEFPIKSLRNTTRRNALGDPAGRLYFGSTQGVVAGVPWKFDADRMVLEMGGREWKIVTGRTGYGSRLYVRGPSGRLYTSLRIVKTSGLVGTRDDMRYRSQGFLDPQERRRTKPYRRGSEFRPLNDHQRAILSAVVSAKA
jgi:hypothetical protein